MSIRRNVVNYEISLSCALIKKQKMFIAQSKEMLLNNRYIVNSLKKPTKSKIDMATCHVLKFMPMYRERTRELQTKLLTLGCPLEEEFG